LVDSLKFYFILLRESDYDFEGLRAVFVTEQVSLDLAKSVYSKYIDWDLQMYDSQTGTPAVATKCVSLSILLVTYSDISLMASYLVM